MTILTSKGPFGPGDIVRPHQVIAGTDRVAIDIRLTGTRFEPGPLPVDTIEIDTENLLELVQQSVDEPELIESVLR